MLLLSYLSLISINILSIFCEENLGRRIFFPVEEKLQEPPCQSYNNQEGTCRFLGRCTTSFYEIAQLSNYPCKITPLQDGICCPKIRAPSRDPSETLNNVVNVKNIPIRFPDVSSNALNFACEQGLRNQTVKESLQQNLAIKHIEVDRNDPAFLHARLFETTPEIIKLSQDANVVLEASKELSKTLQLDSQQQVIGLQKINFKESIIKDKCPKEPSCPDPKVRYRTMDGSCNNIKHKNWGKRGIPFKRMRPADYHDNLNEPRISIRGVPLPSARAVSNSISVPRSDVYANFTINIWQWGQFLDHDITHSPISKGANGVDISCCQSGDVRPAEDLDPECFQIVIADNDDFYSSWGQRCMNFVRSMPAIKDECSFGHREQMNQITSYIDGSNVYGSSIADSQKLRDPTGGGRLKVQHGTINRGDLLPGNGNSGCMNSAEGKECFLAGDSRANEQINLALMHTIWVRQHNNIVQELKRLNPNWNDEVLFQEGRKIVSAQMQHITYNEYLPIVLGKNFMETFGLFPQEKGYFTGYNPNADATIVNVFAAAAFRYGHTLITDTLQGFNEFGQLKEEMQLRSVAFSPFSLYTKGTYDSMVRGLVNQHSQKFDRFFSNELTRMLFAMNGRFGMDLVALNIQRGRDHGIPPYVKWRETCNLSPINNWQDLTKDIKPEIVDALKLVYDDVRDIDLFIAGVSETVIDGSLVGPTFLCILGHQFITLKIGDSFYYENGQDFDKVGPSEAFLASFTPAQLDEIRKTTLARILCDTADDGGNMFIQPLAFVTVDTVNQRSYCQAEFIQRMSLDPWAGSRIWNK